MGSITLEQIVNFILVFGAVLSSGGIICGIAVKSLKTIFEKQLKPINDKVDDIQELHKQQFEALALQTDKNYLVSFLSDIENGVEVDEVAKAHFYFTYDDYHKHNGNSYIDHKVDKLKKEGKL